MIVVAKFLAAGLLCGLACGAQAAMVWDESASGDLSSDPGAPFLLSFTPGTSNVVKGTMGRIDGNPVDRDYFSFTVPEGATLEQLVLLAGTFVSGGASFIGLQAGPMVTVDPESGAGAADLLGYMHYDSGQVGTDLLPSLVLAGFLQSGTYSVWIQETGNLAAYNLDFVVSAAPVPLPAAGALLLGGLGGLAGFRRRRRAV